MTIGNNSFGYVLKGTNTTFNNTAPSTVALGDSAVYLYSNDAAANITSRAKLDFKWRFNIWYLFCRNS